MQTQLVGRLEALGQTSAVKTGEDGGKTPFTETRTVTLVVSPSEDWAGSGEKFQGSQDGGTTWTDLMSQAEINSITPGQVFMKSVALPNQIRGSVATRTGGSIAFYIQAAGS